MGVNDRARDRKEDKARASEEKRKRRSNQATTGTPVDWGSVNGDILARAVAAIARDGGAIRLGYTRDGGAYAVGIYGDGAPFTEYIPPSDDMEAYLRGIIEDYGH